MAFDRASMPRLLGRATGLLRWSRSGCAVSSLRAAFWTLRAARRARCGLATGRLEDISLPLAPRLPGCARRGVSTVLRRERYTCLERALVRQTWCAAHGDRRDLVIGVRAPSAGFAAHAWLDGDPPCHGEGFVELARHPALGEPAALELRSPGSDGPAQSPTGP